MVELYYSSRCGTRKFQKGVGGWGKTRFRAYMYINRCTNKIKQRYTSFSLLSFLFFPFALFGVSCKPPVDPPSIKRYTEPTRIKILKIINPTTTYWGSCLMNFRMSQSKLTFRFLKVNPIGGGGGFYIHWGARTKRERVKEYATEFSHLALVR